MDLIESAVPPQARHPWEEARLRFFGSLLRRSGVAAGAASVLDVGAGDAWVARNMRASFPANARIVCWDTGYSDALLASGDFAGSAQLEFVRERPAGPFGLVLALDVLEHVEDASAFLETLVAENLAQDGHVLVSVPAWPTLFSAHDVHLRHHRRYTPWAARALLVEAGLEVVSAGGLFHSLLLPRAVQKVRERLTRSNVPPPDLSSWRAPPSVTRLVLTTLSLDGAISRASAAMGLELPGLSWWALCRGPKQAARSGMAPAQRP
jgi:2-polyprenyl-3-methyl-5-hydroxy-6-metoxy-1,4-benzoquinol methylase